LKDEFELGQAGFSVISLGADANVRVYKPGRICVSRKCKTVLNRYHKGKYCYRCENQLTEKQILRELSHKNHVSNKSRT